MRSLVGLVIGLLLGVAVVAGLSLSLAPNVGWPVVVVGLVTGVAMWKIAGDHRAGYLRGALAAMATVGASILGQLVAAQVMQQQVMASQQAPLAAEMAAAADAEEGDADAKPRVPTGPLEVRTTPTGVAVDAMRRPKADNSAAIDLALLATGCLVAYGVGKRSTAAPTETDEAAEGEAGDAAQVADAEGDDATDD